MVSVMLVGKRDESGFCPFYCPSLTSLLSDSSWSREAKPRAQLHRKRSYLEPTAQTFKELEEAKQGPGYRRKEWFPGHDCVLAG